jgi:hypothetical protein
MMVLVGIAYRSSDAYLKSNKRIDISSLILTGGWIESLYFSVNAYKAKASDEIKYRIAEQKQTLSSLIKILGSNSSNDISALTMQLKELSQVYETIQFKYNFIEPTTDADKKITYINSTTEVMVNSEQINAITEKIIEIRNKLTNATQS